MSGGCDASCWGGKLGAESVGAGLFPHGIEVVDMRAGENMEVSIDKSV
jgi:hypothetical protein